MRNLTRVSVVDSTGDQSVYEVRPRKDKRGVDLISDATRIQNELARQEENRREHPLKVRIGAAAGEPVEQHHDLFGSTVQLAARLCSHALPEQIVVSNAIAELCLGKGLLFEDLGEVPVKGFARPVRAHAVVWADQLPQGAS